MKRVLILIALSLTLVGFPQGPSSATPVRQDYDVGEFGSVGDDDVPHLTNPDPARPSAAPQSPDQGLNSRTDTSGITLRADNAAHRLRSGFARFVKQLWVIWNQVSPNFQR